MDKKIFHHDLIKVLNGVSKVKSKTVVVVITILVIFIMINDDNAKNDSASR